MPRHPPSSMCNLSLLLAPQYATYTRQKPATLNSLAPTHMSAYRIHPDIFSVIFHPGLYSLSWTCWGNILTQIYRTFVWEELFKTQPVFTVNMPCPVWRPPSWSIAFSLIREFSGSMHDPWATMTMTGCRRQNICKTIQTFGRFCDYP